MYVGGGLIRVYDEFGSGIRGIGYVGVDDWVG